jgi:hypothetical protein
MICQQVTLSGDAEWPKVADAVIEADKGFLKRTKNMGRGYGNLPNSAGTKVGRSSHLTPDIEGSVEELKNRE